MILVDTSVWIDHLRAGEDRLVTLLDSTQVLCHPFVVGELACGNLRNRGEALTLFGEGRLGRAQERRSPHSRDLTERESTVLEALVQGKRNKDIAGELFITERTVKYHVNALFTKLRVQNRTQAVRAAVEQGLVSF